MLLLTSCSYFTPKEKIVYISNHCIIDSPIRPSLEDKKALKRSTISKDFVRRIKDHNDLYEEVCPLGKETKDTSKLIL